MGGRRERLSEGFSEVSGLQPDRSATDSRGAPAATLVARVEAIDTSGCGIVDIDGRKLQVDGALFGEKVLLAPARGRRRRHQARLVEVLEAASARVSPVCPHFGVCGGCGLQHMPAGAQLELKQRRLLGVLEEHGRVQPDALLAPLTGASTGYRRRARLGVKHVPGKGGVLVGFRERWSSKLAELEACAILEARVGDALASLRESLDRLDIRQRIPQIEVAMGDADTAMIVRHLEPLGERDRDVLIDLARARGWQLYVQPGGPDSIEALWPERPAPLSYALPDFDLVLEFLPSDFVQVNAAMNRALVRTAIHHLDLRADSRVLDLFCGIGNFTLAAARRAARVTGVEGDAALVARARRNARRNRITNAAFAHDDLNSVDGRWRWRQERFDRLLLDPPRTGAGVALAALGADLPERIVYVSCNPETLARDAGDLVHRAGYRLGHVGVVDMFPHTMHCEAMAVFTRGGR